MKLTLGRTIRDFSTMKVYRHEIVVHGISSCANHAISFG